MLELKESRGIKHSTLVRYRELTARIYPAIGHIKLKDLRADHLNSLYTAMGKEGAGTESIHATAKADLAALLKQKAITRAGLADTTGLPLKAVYAAVKGQPVSLEVAKTVATALDISLEKTFTVEKTSRTLSAKTVVEHHRLISTVLDQAEKEGRIPFNVAHKTTLPKVKEERGQLFPAGAGC